jgi:Tol biopolymer transport system component
MMRRRIGLIGLISVAGLLAIVLSLSLPGWAQKAKPPQPPVPPADPAIAFCAERSWASSDLMVMNADGTNQKVLLAGTKKPNTISNHDPSWSPDGTRLAFYSDVQGPGIYIIEKNGSGLCKVIAMNEGGSYGAGNPQWSPDGAYILYSDSEGPGTAVNLYLTTAICGSATRINLTNSPNGGEFWPTWSPDGTRLAACVGGDPLDVVVFDLGIGDGGALSAINPINLTATGPLANAFCVEVDWAKSSGRIAVRADSDIWVVYPDAPGVADNLTRTPLIEDRDPSWAPLDAQIVFVCGDSLYKMNPDGTGVTRIASPPSSGKPLRGPAWRRNL